MTPMIPNEYPSTTPILVQALTTTLGAPLTAHLAGGCQQRLVYRWVDGTEYPNARVLSRLHVAFELAVTIGPDACEWFLTRLPGEDGAAPAQLLGWGGLKQSREALLHAARAGGYAVSEQTQTMLAAPRTPRTVLLLDVDGVLIARESVSAIHTAGLSRFDFFQPPYAAPAALWFNPDVIAAISRWVREVPGLEINWLTSWGPAAPGLLAPTLGLPRFPTFAQPTEFDHYRNRPWKRLAILDWVCDDIVVGAPARLVCIDDRDLRGLGAQLRGMRGNGQLERSLVIEPKTSQGLIGSHTMAIDAFLARS